MYKCNFCNKKCKTIQGLLAHKRLKHGIIKKKVAVQDEIERKPVTIEDAQPEEYYEDPREKLLRLEQAALRNEIEKIKAQILESTAPRDINAIVEELENRRAESEKKSEESLTVLPPLPEPPFSDTLKSKIKSLNERVLFR